MQKFDENIKQYLVFVNQCSVDISKLLKKSDFEAKDLEKVSDTFTKRQSLLDKLKSKLQTAKGEDFIARNSEYWNETIQEILRLDAENIENLKLKTGEAGDKVRKILKNKSLLIYSK